MSAEVSIIAHDQLHSKEEHCPTKSPHKNENAITTEVKLAVKELL